MPHLIIEHSNNLSDQVKTVKLAEILHQAVGNFGLFKLQDIKTRVYSAQDFLVGDKGVNGSFAHVTLYIKQGRSVEQRQNVSTSLLGLLQTHLPQADQLSVDIRELDTDVYQKFVR